MGIPATLTDPEKARKRGGAIWPSLLSLGCLVVTTSICDVDLLRALGPAKGFALAGILIVIQALVIWRYVTGFLPTWRALERTAPPLAKALHRLFLLLGVGTSIIAVLGIYVLRVTAGG